MESKEKIEELINTAFGCNLEGVDFLQSLPIDTVRESYNGIGPEFLWPSIRKSVTRHFNIFAPAAVIHDLRNEFSDGTRESFHAANNEFRANCLKLVDMKYPPDVKSPRQRLRRDLARKAANAFFRFVDGAPGWRAWLEAQANHAKKISSGNSAGSKNKE